MAQVGKIEEEKASSVRTGMASLVLQPHTPLWPLVPGEPAVFAAWVTAPAAALLSLLPEEAGSLRNHGCY